MEKELSIKIFNDLLKAVDMNPKQLSDHIGKEKPQWAYDVLNEKKKSGISKNIADLICEKFPYISKSYLLTGEGNIRSDIPNGGEIKEFREGTQGFKLVPLINLDVVGGMHSQNEVINQAEFILGTIAFNDALEGDRCIQVSGHSMEPVCPPGSIVLIRPVEFWREYFGFGNLFVILLKDGRRILKKVVKSLENPKDNVTCVSLNKEYPEEDLPKDFIQGVWKVIKILVDRGW
jgi:hypothetical protein